jgi:hypothetical protein
MTPGTTERPGSFGCRDALYSGRGQLQPLVEPQPSQT